jgi:hypothetical protein
LRPHSTITSLPQVALRTEPQYGHSAVCGSSQVTSSGLTGAPQAEHLAGNSRRAIGLVALFLQSLHHPGHEPLDLAKQARPVSLRAVFAKQSPSSLGAIAAKRSPNRRLGIASLRQAQGGRHKKPCLAMTPERLRLFSTQEVAQQDGNQSRPYHLHA